MTTYRTSEVTVSRKIFCFFKCHHCGEMNLNGNEIRSSGSATTSYAPFSKAKKDARDQRLREEAAQKARENSDLSLQIYEEQMNEQRNTSGLKLVCRCEKCGKLQAWTNIPEISLSRVIIWMLIGLVVGMCIKECLDTKVAGTVCAMIAVGTPLIYVLTEGWTAYRNQKIMDQLSAEYMPIALTENNLEQFLEKMYSGQLVSEMQREKNPRVNAGNVLWNVLRVVCLIAAGVCFTGYLAFGHKLIEKVEYQPYSMLLESGTYVTTDLTSAMLVSEYAGEKYYLFENTDRNPGYVVIGYSNRPEGFKSGVEISFDEPLTIYGILESMEGQEDVKVIKAFSEVIKEEYVEDDTKCGPGWILEYLSGVFIVMFVLLQIKCSLNKLHGGN